MRNLSKLFMASTLAVLGLTARAESPAPAAPSQAPSATAEPTPATAQDGAPDAAPQKGLLYYKPGEKPRPRGLSQASSQPPGSPGRHRRGTYLRFDGGVGYQSQSWTEDGVDLKFDGPALNLAGSFGGAIAEDVFLAGRIFFGAAPNPRYTVGSESMTTSGVTTNIVGFGPEFIYYFMPANVYLSTSVAVTRQTMQLPGNKAGATEIGWGAQGMIGKEWWVTNRISMGLAGQVTYASNPNLNFTVSGFNAGLVYSFTMN